MQPRLIATGWLSTDGSARSGYGYLVRTRSRLDLRSHAATFGAFRTPVRLRLICRSSVVLRLRLVIYVRYVVGYSYGAPLD